MGWIIYAAAGGVALLVLIVIIVVVATSQKKSKNKADVFKVVQEADPSGDADMNKTIVMAARNDDGCTRMMWSDPAGRYTLYLTDVRNPARMFQTALNGRVVIGRKAGEADLVIGYENSISGRHCMISERMGRFYIQDLQSTNGTMLNGVPVTSEMEAYSGSLLTLGKLEMKLEIR